VTPDRLRHVVDPSEVDRRHDVARLRGFPFLVRLRRGPVRETGLRIRRTVSYNVARIECVEPFEDHAVRGSAEVERL